MKLEMAIAPTRLVAMCLGPEAGGAFDIFAKSRAGALVQMKSRLRSKPLRSTRSTFVTWPAMAEGCCSHGASQFSMTLGNDFAAVVAAVGSGRAAFALLVETLRYRGSHSGATHFRN